MKAKAVFITRDSNESLFARIWCAKKGITKVEGCVEYYSGHKDEHWPMSSDGHIEILNVLQCKRRYGFFPAPAEAWLVRPTKHYWMWQRVDHKMALLNTGGEAIAYKHRRKVMKI